MKKTVLALTLFGCLNAYSSPRTPDMLPDGAYSFECTSINVGTSDQSGFYRRVSLESGKVIVSSFENKYVERTSSTYDFDGTTYRSESIQERELKQLSKDTYLLTTKAQDRMIGKFGSGDEDLGLEQQSWKSVVRVQDNFLVTLNVELAGEAIRSGQGESHTRTLADGTIEVVGYTRGLYRRERKELEDGAYRPGTTTEASNSICSYKPLN